MRGRPRWFLADRAMSVCRQMSAARPLVGSGWFDEPCVMDAHLPRRATLRGAVAALATVIVLTAAGPAGAATSGSLTVTFDGVATTGDWHGGHALGTFAMTGMLGDAGTLRIAYRLSGRHIRATATLIGAQGILTIGLRATINQALNDHQGAVGRWRACGGTGPYRRLVGEGDWTAVVDVLATSMGDLPRALHGAYSGRVYRSSPFRRAGFISSRDAPC